MVCRSCGQETKGIKVNERLFCTNCGEELYIEAIPMPEIPETPINPVSPRPNTFTAALPKRISKDGQEITPEDEEREIDLLEAAEETVEVIEKESKENGKKETEKVSPRKKHRSKVKPIIKHNRERIDNRNKKDYLLVPAEPDPISKPELTSPHDDQIEEPKEPLTEMDDTTMEIDLSEPDTDARYPLVDKEEIENMQQKQLRHQEALTNFLRRGASQATKGNFETGRGHNRWRIFLIFFLSLLILCSLVGLAFYVNLYNNGVNPAIAGNTLYEIVSSDKMPDEELIKVADGLL